MKRSIFYFDDDVDCLNIFQDVFSYDYEVHTASVLSEARRLLAERPFDIVISDQDMPEIDGTEFLCEVAQNYPASYRALLTGTMTVGEAFPELMSGIAHSFVPKPWTEEHMRVMLGRASLHFDLRRIDM